MPREGTGAAVGDDVALSPDMLANIHGRLGFLDRLAFTSAFRDARVACKPEAPWLVLPGDTPEKVTLFSLADRRSAAARAPDPALRGHAVIGSSRGWLATADARGRMCLVNPVSGEQRALPAITTIPGLDVSGGGFVFWLKPFVRGPPYAGGGEPAGTFTLTAEQMRGYLYRKVVLSDFSVGAAAMLVTGPLFGVPAFATPGDAAWRLAPSRGGVEDAIHHQGRFYSVTYTGTVEAWERDPYSGVFTSAAVTPPTLADVDGDPSLRRRYLAAAPGGRLMVVLKEWRDRDRLTCSFKVQVLDGGQWKETDDIGDAALFVGANESLCLSTRVHTELSPGCVYYTDDDLSQGRNNGDDGRRVIGVFCLKDGTEQNAAVGVFCHEDGSEQNFLALGQRRSWPPPAWFTPSLP